MAPAPAAMVAEEPVFASIGAEVLAGAFVLRMPVRALTGAGLLPFVTSPRVVTLVPVPGAAGSGAEGYSLGAGV